MKALMQIEVTGARYALIEADLQRSKIDRQGSMRTDRSPLLSCRGQMIFSSNTLAIFGWHGLQFTSVMTSGVTPDPN